MLLLLATPAYIANMMPVVAARLNWLPNLNHPIDCNKKIRGRELFGSHKTWRGFVVGILSSTLFSIALFWLSNLAKFELPFIIDYKIAAIFGFLAGSGALLADAIESFFKRQLGIKSGEPFIPFDQIDYIIGFMLLTNTIINWKVGDYVFLILFALVANPITNYVSYKLKIKSTFW